MINGENTTIIEYEVNSKLSQDVRLELRPLIAFRDYHSTTHANGSINAALDNAPNLVSVEPYPDLPRLYLAHNASMIEGAGNWYFNFEYYIERERGLDYREDLFCPFVAIFDLTRKRSAALIASTKPHDISTVNNLRDQEIARRKSIRNASPCDDPLITTLFSAADQFIVKRGDLYSIIAGYHWFSDWGRDAMISLPGLTLVTGRHDIAKSILLGYAAHIDQGMLPNRFRTRANRPSTTRSMPPCGLSKQFVVTSNTAVTSILFKAFTIACSASLTGISKARATEFASMMTVC